MMCYGLRLNWNYRKQRFCNPHFTCVVYGSYNGGVHPSEIEIMLFIDIKVYRYLRGWYLAESRTLI